MIEPVSVPIILDLELSQVEYDLSVEEAEEYAAQIGSLITVTEIYGGLPSGGATGEVLIKNSDEDYDAIWGIIKSGTNIWWTNHSIIQGETSIYTPKRYIIGRTDIQPEIHDFLIGRDIGAIEGTPNTLYEIIDDNLLVYSLKRIGGIGENIESHGLPSGGTAGQLLVKQSDSDYNVAWISPADSAEQDNTRPITAAAVYTEIGNINTLLATI